MKMLERLRATAIILKHHKLKFAALLMVFSLTSFALPLAAPFMIQSIMGSIESGASATPWMVFIPSECIRKCDVRKPYLQRLSGLVQGSVRAALRGKGIKIQ